MTFSLGRLTEFVEYKFRGGQLSATLSPGNDATARALYITEEKDYDNFNMSIVVNTTSPGR